MTPPPLSCSLDYMEPISYKDAAILGATVELHADDLARLAATLDYTSRDRQILDDILSVLAQGRERAAARAARDAR